MTAKVYVPQFVRGCDYTGLEKYGEVVFITHLEYPREPCPDDERWRVIREIKRGLDKFRPKVDFLALSASPIPNFIAGSRLQQMTHDKFGDNMLINVLKYNNHKMGFDRFKIEV